MSPAPHLRFTGDDQRAEAVALLLHGGMPDSLAPVREFHSGVLRMVPFGPWHNLVAGFVSRTLLTPAPGPLG